MSLTLLLFFSETNYFCEQFRIQTAPHERFRREGNDLHTTVTISLVIAFTLPIFLLPILNLLKLTTSASIYSYDSISIIPSSGVLSRKLCSISSPVYIICYEYVVYSKSLRGLTRCSSLQTLLIATIGYSALDVVENFILFYLFIFTLPC